MTPRHARAPFASLAGLLLALSFAPAAQAQVTPMSVNDCTLLPDPGALRRCLDQAEGRVVATPPPLSNATGLGQPAPEAQATRPAASPPVLAPAHSNFLAGRGSRPVEARPPKKNVIDLN